MKPSFKNIVQHAALCTAVACIFFIPLLCMDKLERGKDIAWVPSSPVAQTLSFLLTEKLNLFSHDMICSLGITRECERVLMNNAGKIRQCFTKQIADGLYGDRNFLVFGHEEKFWHKYGTACAKIVQQTENDETLFRLRLICFGDKYCLFDELMGRNSRKDISSLVQPRFGENGHFCYYQVEKPSAKGCLPCLIDESGKYCCQIVEHSRTIKAYHCDEYAVYLYDARALHVMISKDNFGELFVGLISFLSFPVLLNACINALVERGDNMRKFCDLKKVHLPDDYKKCVPHDQSSYKSYAELPEFWREMIDAHYVSQRQY